MRIKLTKRKVLITLLTGVIITGCLIIYAFARTWNKTELEFRIHINDKLVRQSVFGESPTFAIWLEEPETGLTKTIFVTNRAGLGDWEGKTSVPVALPKWFDVNETEQKTQDLLRNKIPEKLTITGATPKPGYFSTRVRVAPGSSWICWIEVNLAGDFNESYPEYDEVKKTADEFKTGQPALVFRAEVEAVYGNSVKPEITGMSLLDSTGNSVIQAPSGISTAYEIFDEMNIIVVKPKPRIIEW